MACVALVGLPALALAPQNDITARYDDQFLSYVSDVPRIAPQTPGKTLSQESQAWREYLKTLTTEEEFQVLDCLATLESRWRNVPNYLYDGEDGKYTAFGPFQVLKSTAATYSPNDRREPYENIRIAVALYRARGATPWLVWPNCIR